MSDLTTPQDLETNKKHIIFYNEVATGKAGGLAGGADIPTATNPVTGQTQKTLTQQLADEAAIHDAQIAAHEAEFDGRLAGMAFVRVGTFAAGYTLTDMRQTLLHTDGHEYGWTGAFPKVVAAGSSPTPTGSGEWIDRSDVTMRDEIPWAFHEFHVSNSVTLTSILTMTIGPITVRAPIGRFPSPPGSLWRDGITLVGEQMPHISADGGRLENGTVFTGSVDVFKKSSGNILNCGFDCGPDYVGSGGTPGNGLMITNTLESEQTTNETPIYNWVIDNVSGLCMPASETHKYHGLLFEGMEDSHVGYVVGYNGIASVVIKNKNSTCGTLVGYNGDPYTVTVKSNKYAPVENVIVDSILSFGGGGVTIVSDDPTPVGAALKNVSIGNVVVRGGKTGCQGTSTDSQPIDGLTVGNLVVTGTTVGAGGFSNGAKNVKIGQHYVQGCANGIGVVGNADVHLGNGSSIGNGQFGYVISSPNARAGDIHSEFNGVNGTYITTGSFRVGSYYGSSHAEKEPVSTEITGLKVGITTSKTVVSAIEHRCFSGGKVSIDMGVISGSCNVGDVIATIPAGILPLYDQSGFMTVNDGTEFIVKPISIGVSGGIIALFSTSSATWTMYLSGVQFSYL